MSRTRAHRRRHGRLVFEKPSPGLPGRAAALLSRAVFFCANLTVLPFFPLPSPLPDAVVFLLSYIRRFNDFITVAIRF